MRLIVKNKNGEFEISGLCLSIVWSGDFKSCARTLVFKYAVSASDPSVPKFDVEIMNPVSFFIEGVDAAFTGNIWKLDKQAGASFFTATCYDRGYYLKKIKVSKRYSKKSPEDIAAELCEEYGIETAHIVPAGITVTKNFFGKSIYDIIMSCYTLASESNGKQYQLSFIGNRLSVFQRGETSGVVIDGQYNMISANMSQSAENVVTRVKIYNSDDKFVKDIDNNEARELYGVLQEYLKQTKDDNSEKKAQELLKKGKLEQKVTVENLGDKNCVCGKSLIVRDSFSGVDGLFYIDGDTHTWQNSQYTNKLTLNFENIMNEVEAGTDDKQ